MTSAHVIAWRDDLGDRVQNGATIRHRLSAFTFATETPSPTAFAGVYFLSPQPKWLCGTERLGRAIWKKWSGYDRRSPVETKMRCFKLLGERVKARIFNSQVAELQIRAAISPNLLASLLGIFKITAQEAKLIPSRVILIAGNGYNC